MTMARLLSFGVLALGLGFSQPAAANDFHGAMAYDSKTGAHGWASDYTSKKKAALC